MLIRNIVIKNFRALEEAHLDLSEYINVIVGPNAIGKTTVLQAVRLVKALLAPRTNDEAQHVLMSLGAASQHFPQRLFLPCLARDPTRKIEIRATVALSQDEISSIRQGIKDLIRGIVMSRIGQSFANPAALVNFLNSPQGLTLTQQVDREVDPYIARLRSSAPIILGIDINCQTGQIEAQDPTAGALITFLDQHLPPNQTILSYFPADRALPLGETPIQLGAADSQQQIESHNAQPQIKYQRMKNLIFSTIVMGEPQRKALDGEFQKIFNGILKGRKIDSIGVNDLGMLSVMTEELDTNRKIEIDNLSSGEKNLLLTFLLIANSITRGGVVLFDEPELHLNPAVCREMLKFMMHEYAKPRGIQFIICTHSPEILAGAFSDDECSLHHIKTPSLVSKISRRALDEYSDALARLGTSVSESLLYEGTLLVEGDTDVEFLQTGFSDLLKKFKVKDRGGRREVEKTAKKIQELEAAGENVSPIFIIIDKDEEKTNLNSSNNVKILQWDRKCIENYLIDLDVITALMKNTSMSAHCVSTRGEVENILRELAMQQLNNIASRQVYQNYGYRNPVLWNEDINHKDIPGVASALYNRLLDVKNSLNFGDRAPWESNFISECQAARQKLEIAWESQWTKLCDGKQLFDDLQKTGRLKIGISEFKRKIMEEMRESKSENWNIMEHMLRKLLNKEQENAASTLS